jgi:transposase
MSRRTCSSRISSFEGKAIRTIRRSTRFSRNKGFDKYAEETCAKFYAKRMGRPSLAPGVYFRCLLLGYFEGIDSERGIAWRAADSLSLRDFLGIPASKPTPDHSTISKTRKRIELEAHQSVFTWVLGALDAAGLIKGKTIGVDGTTLEANAAMKSIVRRDDGRSYEEFLTDLAKASGIETPTREDLARVDRKRKKKGSNTDWYNPFDPDAKITKMKDGRTHLAHKEEHAVDMDTGAVVAVTLQGADQGDTSTLEGTLAAAEQNLDDAKSVRARSRSARTNRKKQWPTRGTTARRSCWHWSWRVGAATLRSHSASASVGKDRRKNATQSTPTDDARMAVVADD